jgi:hypothetical protein
MRPCRDCQHQVSEQAFACPNCGAPFPAAEPLSSPRLARALLLTALACAAIGGYLSHIFIEAYREMLEAFGRPVPATDLVRSSPLLVVLLPLIVLGVWRLWPKSKERSIAALVVAVAFVFVLPGLASLIMSQVALR